MERFWVVMHALGLMHMGKMEKKLVGNAWNKRDLDQNGSLGFLWVDQVNVAGGHGAIVGWPY